MSEKDDQERTEQPSEKRLREAREKGDVPRSRDLSGALVSVAGVASLMAGGAHAWTHAQNIYRLGLSYDRASLLSGELPLHVLGLAGREALLLFAPVAAATLLAALATPLLLGGLSFSGGALMPKFDHLDPVAGLGRMFSMRGAVELGKSLLKLAFIGGALLLLLRHASTSMLATGRGNVGEGIAASMKLLGRSALLFGALLCLIGGIDAIYQRFDHTRRLRMTKQELRDESKETDGNPELKGRIRQMQHQMSRKRMMQDLPKADVVITNPTHFAVALCYDDSRMGAPRVIAKGVDVLAQQIRTIAAGHRIPLVEAPPLARALYATTELGREVPATLYVAVAQVLAYVYQLKQAAERGAALPDLPVPQVDPDLLGPYRES